MRVLHVIPSVSPLHGGPSFAVRGVAEALVAQGIDVIISGHSHMPKIATVDGLLYVNPGSAGRRRFKLPITLASLEVTPDGLKPIIHDLEVG